MNPLTWVGLLAGALNNYLQDKLTQEWGQAAQDAIRNAIGLFTSAVQGLVDSGQQEKGAVQYSDQYAAQVGHDFEEIEGWWENTIDHVTFTILPHSLLQMRKWINDNWIAPLNATIQVVQGDIKLIWQWENAINLWQTSWVDPHLSKFDTFLTDFYRGDQPAINALNDWLRYPVHFAEWATPPLVGSIVAYLADERHETIRDDLTRIMVQAWSEKPIDVWDAIEQWLVTDQGS